MSTAQIGAELPYPLRFWWLKRVAIASIAFIALVALLWIIWNYDANRRLNAAIAATKAQGDSLSLADIAEEPVPDAENYVNYLTQAIAAYNQNAYSPSASNMNYENRLPLPEEWYTMAAGAVAGNKAALNFMRIARQYSKIDWGIRHVPRPKILSIIQGPSLNAQRSLGELLSDTAEYQHLQGNDDESIETLMDLFTMTGAISKNPTLISYLVAMGIDELGTERVLFIAPGLSITGPASTPTTNPSNKPATRAQILSLLHLLLKIDPLQRYRDALQSERVLSFDLGQWYAEKSLLLAPMYKLDSARDLNQWQATLSTPPGTFPIAAVTKRTSNAPQDPISNWSHVLSGGTTMVGRLNDITLKYETSICVAAVSLAVRLYQLDHAGQWPATLDVLVPEYLPALPIDPYSKTSQPLTYILVDGHRPVVFLNLSSHVDFKWLTSVLAPEPQYSSSESMRKLSIDYRDLSRFEPPPTTQPQGQ